MSKYYFLLIFFLISSFFVLVLPSASFAQVTPANGTKAIGDYCNLNPQGPYNPSNYCPANFSCQKVSNLEIYTCGGIIISSSNIPGTAKIIVNPNQVSISTAFQIIVTGNGSDTYILYIFQQGQLVNPADSITFKVTDQCSIIDGNRITFTNLNCKIIDKDKKIWQFTTAHKGLVEGHWQTQLNRPFNGGFNTSTNFRVGNPSTQDLTVTADPAGPFNNNIENTIILKWEPTVNGEKYYITGPAITVPGETICYSNTVCSKPVNIPKETPGGDLTLTVNQDGGGKKGSVTIKINPIVAPNPANVKPTLTPASSPGGAGQLCTLDDGKPVVNPGYAQRNPKNIGILTAIGCVPTEPTQFILAVSRLATGMGGGIALLLMIVGAFKMITSAGNPDSVKAGSEQITSAIIGLLFIIFAVLLLKVIGVDILDLPGFGSTQP